MRYLLISGEASGSRIAAQVIADIRQQDTRSHISTWGDQSLSTIADSHHPSAQHRMGLMEIIGSIPSQLSALRLCKKYIVEQRPDIIILIDNAGWNMRLLPWLKSKNLKVVYLIPPKTWASRSWRERALRRYCDLLIVGYEFEYDYFIKKGLPVRYYGHPYLSQTSSSSMDPSSPLAILPGSRQQEINYMMPIYTALIQSRSHQQYIISVIPGVTEQNIQKHLPTSDNYRLVTSPISEWLQTCSMAIVTSGTASIEVAALDVPQIVCYRMHPLTYQIARRMIRTPYISLPNLIANRPLVPELIQSACTAENINTEIERLSISDEVDTQRIGYLEVRKSLAKNSPFYQAARDIIALATRTDRT